MTTTQLKFFLKLLLLKASFVDLLSGRSIPGVTESTPEEFHSLCFESDLAALGDFAILLFQNSPFSSIFIWESTSG